MPSFTRQAIKETFLELLDERPLSEITIKDIVEKCGINRNSFYYHFQDLPALIEEIIREESDAVIRKYSSVTSIVECFNAVVEFASHRKRAIMHIYKSVSRDVFERYLMQTSLYFVQNYINIALKEEPIHPEDKEIIINYYKCVCFGLIIDWLNSGMKEESVQALRKLFRIKANMTVELAKLMKN